MTLRYVTLVGVAVCAEATTAGAMGWYTPVALPRPERYHSASAGAGSSLAEAGRDTTVSVRDSAKEAHAPAPKSQASVRRPLERLVQERIMVLPVQFLTFTDSLGWAGEVLSIPEYLKSLDSTLAVALEERGLKGRWTFAPAVVRSVKRNPTLDVDPYGLGAEQVRMGTHPDSWQLGEPLASRLRSIVALSEARYVLLPVELHFGNAPGAKGAGYATFRVAVIDARRAQLQWVGEIASAPAAKLTPALLADVASHTADLIAPSSAR